MLKITTKTSTETKKIAFVLAKEILKMPPANHAFIIALEGNLGAGKTTFVQGLARGLGIQEAPKSPTFVLMNIYPIGKIQITKSKFQIKSKIQKQKQKNLKTYKHLVHIDCYRIESAKELSHLGVEEIFNDPHSIVLIEWADKIKKILPKSTTRISFRHGIKSNERRLQIF